MLKKRIEALEKSFLAKYYEPPPPTIVIMPGDSEPENLPEGSNVIRFTVKDAVKPDLVRITRGTG